MTHSRDKPGPGLGSCFRGIIAPSDRDTSPEAADPDSDTGGMLIVQPRFRLIFALLSADRQPRKSRG